MTSVQYEKICDFSTFNIPKRQFRARGTTYISTTIELLRKTSIAPARGEEMEARRNIKKMEFLL